MQILCPIKNIDPHESPRRGGGTTRRSKVSIILILQVRKQSKNK